MKTEISRDSHQPKKCYSGVYQQQGRMLTDADWNELVDILKERLNDALKDVVGCKEGGIGGTPRHRPLKVIIDSDDNDKLTIQPGHVYVDGVAAQIPGEAVISYDAQPDFPSPPNPSGDYVLYADVWERTVTHLMDERLRDKGLHGADTCTRKQTMCQVKWCSFVEGGPDNIDPEQSDKNPSKGNARLSVGLLNKSAHPDPCDPCADQIEVDSKVGNYLFRVEVHDVEGDADKTIKITLKWSSENGAEQFEAKDKNDMPASFLTGNWVYEFFNDTSEKHLGVHLASGVGFPVRDNLLHEGYPESPLPDGFDFVRRWDGYATFEWVGTEWQLTAGKDKDKGEGLSVASSSTIADQVVNLDSVELKLQLLSRVVSGLVTDAALITGDLIINTRPIDASGAGDDGVSTVKKASSAIAKAAAINAGSGDTKVWAIVNPNVVEGAAPSAFIAGTDDFGTGDLKINNISVDAVSAAGDQSAQAKAVVEVINKAFPGKKVVASETDDVVRLVAADGRNIDIELSGRASEARCGFSKGTYYSTITLASRSAIDIEGVHPEHAGLVKGTTPAVQFVAGDYWLADVREAEHEAGDPLITNETPQGIVHHYLTIGTVKGVVLQPNPEADRKYAFPPLTEMTRMFHVGGDGQEAMPDHSVPQPLKVGVTNGEWPVAGARVEFRVATGGGLLGAHSDFSLDVNAADQSGVTTTDEKGMAKCLWRLGSEGSTPLEKTEQRKQKLIVRLLNPNYDPSDSESEKYLDHPPVQFYANLSTADQVAYVNPVCTDSPSVNSLLQSDSNDHGVFSWPDLDKDGDVTVKDVLDALLCKLRAKHIPYDVTGSNSARWADVNEEEVAKPPDTVQEAIDALLENLHSEDIKYPLPDCSPDTNTLKHYLQSYIQHNSEDASDRFRIKALWDALLCHLDAAKLPYNPNVSPATTSRWRDINEQPAGDLTEPNTVQEAIDDLIKWLESTDIRYQVPKCGTAASPTVRSLLPIVPGSRKIDEVLDKLLCDLNANHLPFVPESCLHVEPTVKTALGITAETTVHEVLQKLICDLDASKTPYDPTIQEERWQDANPDTVQVAIDLLLQRILDPKLVEVIINHLKNKNNPHEVTAIQTGAIPDEKTSVKGHHIDTNSVSISKLKTILLHSGSVSISPRGGHGFHLYDTALSWLPIKHVFPLVSAYSPTNGAVFSVQEQYRALGQDGSRLIRSINYTNLTDKTITLQYKIYTLQET